MNKILLVLAFAYCPLVSAHELDSEVTASTSVGPAQAAALPQTIVIRRNVKTGQVEYLNVANKIPANKALAAKLESAPFQSLSVDGDLTSTMAANEKDAVSSTSSWGFGFTRPGFGFGRPGFGYARPAYGYGYARPAYGYGYTRPYNGYYNNYRSYVSAYAPAYYYGGSAYAYNPYYTYNTGAYQYAYCDTPVQQAYNCSPGYSCAGGYAPSYANSGYNNYWRW